MLIPPSYSQASNQCVELFEDSQKFSFAPLMPSSFETNIESLVKPKEVERAFEELKNFMYQDGKLTSEYLNLKSDLVKKSIIPLKKSEQKFVFNGEDGVANKIPYVKVLERIEEGVKELHPHKIKNVADFLTLSQARKNKDQIDYKEAEALENLYRKVETNIEAMRGRPKAQVNPGKILKDAAKFLKGEDTWSYTKKFLVSGAIVDAIAVLMFRYMEMSTGQAYWNTEMLFYFAQGYVSFQLMLMLTNPIYTNSRLTHRQSFVKTYATSVAVYTMFVPVFRFLHDQFLGGSSIPVSPMMMGTYASSMFLYALAWKIPNELIFRKIISPIFFDHFLSETAYREIINVKKFSKDQLLEKFYKELQEVTQTLEMVESVNTFYYDAFTGNMNGKYAKTYQTILSKLIGNSRYSEAQWKEVLSEYFGITENNPRVKHPEVIERDLFALSNQHKGIKEKIKWTNFFRKGLKPGEAIPRRKIAFYYSYEQMGRVFTASVMLSAFIVGQKLLVGDSMFTLDGLFSQVLTHMSGVFDAYNSSNYGN
ncbi:MAG: hypothetical protein MK008_10990 [Bdellovibrionales bacterium]|nr:hypothetical protein [Bdellovibrionales bacterium]